MATKFVTNLDLNQNQILNGKFEVLATDPIINNFEGRMIYNSTEDVIKVYSGSAWRKMLHAVQSGGTYTDAITITESNGTITVTLNLADTDSAGLLSSTFWNDLNGATSDATASKLAKRDANGNLKVAAPSDGAHAATKTYVDTAVGAVATSFTVTGDSGTSQTITSGSDTLTIAGGTGIDTVAGATDTVTINIDSTVATLTGIQTLSNKTLTSPIVDGTGVIFEGATANEYETTLTATDPTADRTITLQDASGTVALLGTIALGTDTTGNYVNDITAGTGVSVSHTPGEGSSPTVSIGQAVGTSDSPTFAGLTINGASVVFEGATANDYETTISITDPTADRTITVPDVSGTVITTGNLSSITSVGTLSSLTISGDLTVNGTTTTINSTTVTVDDKNLELGSTASPSDAGADGGGITLKGTTDKTFNWVDATDAWTSSEHLNLASGKSYYINGTQVLSSSTLGSGVTGSSLTSVGTITTGVWNGTDIAVLDGGTGASTASDARTNLAATTAGTTSTPVLARVAAQGNAAHSSGTSTTTVTHNFGTRDVVVQVYEVATYATVIADAVRTDANTVTVTILGNVSADAYRIVVTG